MAIWKEDVTGFDYAKNGYAIYDKLTIGDVKNARINTKHQRAITISLLHGNTLSECTKSLKTCYDVAVKARSLYAGAYHQNFPVSVSVTISLADLLKLDTAMAYAKKYLGTNTSVDDMAKAMSGTNMAGALGDVFGEQMLQRLQIV
ncbi:hypothetical protein [Lysinibacillus sp. FJAT-14745]|uniref:hypothetical protein n=1 Tax=Lysinibacillus sp. FJAT-14745 TaxID=1704289 RepID=UPI0009E844FE|nr:hypothetical protein [Lysinibacillus sp. FJAT-14745]